MEIDYHRPLRSERIAQIACQDVLEIGDVLDVEWFIQTPIMSDFCNNLGISNLSLADV